MSPYETWRENSANRFYLDVFKVHLSPRLMDQMTQDVISQSIWLGKRGFHSTTLKILMGELLQCIDFAGHIKNFNK